MPNTRTLTYIATATLGLALWLFGALDDGHIDLADIRTAGVLVLTFTFLAVIAGRSVVNARAVDAARLTAYDVGFEAGCVAKDRSDCDGAFTLTLLRAPQQLVEQEGIGS